MQLGNWDLPEFHEFLPLTYMKEGLLLLLLLLYDGTGELSKGLHMMLSRVVSASCFDVDSFCIGEYRSRDMEKSILNDPKSRRLFLSMSANDTIRKRKQDHRLVLIEEES
jgi:hypothetical protein